MPSKSLPKPKTTQTAAGYVFRMADGIMFTTAIDGGLITDEKKLQESVKNMSDILPRIVTDAEYAIGGGKLYALVELSTRISNAVGGRIIKYIQPEPKVKVVKKKKKASKPKVVKTKAEKEEELETLKTLAADRRNPHKK